MQDLQKKKGTPKKCVDPAHLCFFFKKSSCKPESESLQFPLAPFTSHKHISTSFLHSNAASSVLFKAWLNHRMGFHAFLQSPGNKTKNNPQS